MRHAAVKLDGQEMPAKLVDLPCIVETLKTFDKKNFYKVADVSQMLLCGPEALEPAETSDLSGKKAERKWQSCHGVTAPLKNVRKKRFRKTRRKKFLDAPEVDRELKRLLRVDFEAVSVRWEVLTLDEVGGKQQLQQAGQMAKSRPAVEGSLVPEDSSLPAGLREDDIFGAKVSSSESGSDDEGEAMARLLMGDVRVRRNGATIPMTAPSPVADISSRQKRQVEHLQARLTDCQSALTRVELQKRGQEAQLKAVDNPVLQQRMTAELDGLIEEENRLSTEITELTEQISLMAEST